MPDTPHFELFGFWRSSATFRVRVALALKGLSAHEHVINLDKGEQRSATFLALNPLGARSRSSNTSTRPSRTRRCCPPTLAAAWRAWQIKWFAAGLTALEQRLQTETETGTYCHGDSITIADICLASILAVMHVFDIEVPNTPAIDRIADLCDKHDAFARAYPLKQPCAPDQP